MQRSYVSGLPFLELEPVKFSLTEGTQIPPPPAFSPRSDEFPKSPTTLRKELSKDRLSTYAGPLSSHPVTPIENNGEGVSNGFPFARVNSNRSGDLVNRESSANDLGKTITETHEHSGLTHHQHNNVTTAREFLSSSTMPPPSVDSGRPSVASRFLRFRSLSSLKRFGRGKSNLNSSNLNSSTTIPKQQEYNDQDSGYGTPGTSIRQSRERTMRGLKRPASPSIDSNNDFESGHGRSRANSASFPRLMRKKSMEWFGTARRKSGMWGGTEDRPIIDEPERAQSRQMGRGKDSMMSESNYGDDASPSSDNVKEPPPAIDELRDFGGALDGQEMFGTIGR